MVQIKKTKGSWVVFYVGGLSVIFLLPSCGGGGRQINPPQTKEPVFAVQSSPSGAQMWLNGTRLPFRTTPIGAPAEPIPPPEGEGPHLLTVTLSGYHPWNQWVYWTGDGSVIVRASLVPDSSPQLRVSIRSDPFGAIIWLNGNRTGQTTPAALSLPPTAQALRLELPGHFAAYETLLPSLDGDREVFIPLTPLDRGLIVGTVYDRYANGLFGAVVKALDSRGTMVSQTRSGPFGSFYLGALPSGLYRLEAEAEVEGRREVGVQDQVRVEAGKRTVASLVLVDRELTGEVRGVVLDNIGQPASDALVTSIFYALGTDWVLSSRRVRTDPAGRFTFDLLPAGPIVLTAYKDGFYPGQSSFVLQQEERRTVTINLRLGSDFPTPSPPKKVFAIGETLPVTLPESVRRWVGPPQNFYRSLIWKHRGRSHRLSQKVFFASPRQPSRYFPTGFWAQVEVGWDLPEEPIKGFEIWRAQPESSGWVLRSRLEEPKQSLFADGDFNFQIGPTYLYAVKSIGLDGRPSHLSEAAPVRLLPVVRLLSPESGETVPLSELVFRWQTSGQSVPFWTVQLFPDLESLLVRDPMWRTVTTSQSARYDGPPLLSGKSYYWIVIGQDKADWLEARSFTVSELRKVTVLAE
ncbi:MAG: carboxypeptidase regulatory-like domain-containing protein [Armatimonadota bacterium]|nr:carboxypeptidase regulatory-like domain-containing protein [Armatimonadota bacterium]